MPLKQMFITGEILVDDFGYEVQSTSLFGLLSCALTDQINEGGD